jgi:hypothetical protein
MNSTNRAPAYLATAAQPDINGRWATSIGLIVLLVFAERLGLLSQVIFPDMTFLLKYLLTKSR